MRAVLPPRGPFGNLVIGAGVGRGLLDWREQTGFQRYIMQHAIQSVLLNEILDHILLNFQMFHELHRS